MRVNSGGMLHWGRTSDIIIVDIDEETRILNQSDRGHTSARQEQPDMIDVNIGTQQQQQPRNANGERIDEDLVFTMAQI